MKYHVTPKWNEENLQTAVEFLGESEAVEMFMTKWETPDSSYAIDQVHKIYLYATIDEAREHQEVYGGEILEIDDQWLDIFEDWTEGSPVLATRNSINKDYIRKIK